MSDNLESIQVGGETFPALELLPRDAVDVPGQPDPLDAMKRCDVPAIKKDLLERMADLFTAADAITVTEEHQVALMKMAHTSRMVIKDFRIRAEEVLFEAAEGALRTKQEIDEVRRLIKEACKKREKRLDDMEHYADRMAEARRAELLTQRTEMLAPFTAALGIETIPLGLGDISGETFDVILNTFRTDLREKQEREAAALRAAEEAEAHRVAEEKRLRDENARLEREAQAAEAERQRVAAEAKAEQDRRDAEARKLREESEAREAAIREQARVEKARIEAENELQRAAERAEAQKRQDEADAKARVEREAFAADQRKRDEARRKEEARLDALANERSNYLEPFKGIPYRAIPNLAALTGDEFQVVLNELHALKSESDKKATEARKAQEARDAAAKAAQAAADAVAATERAKAKALQDKIDAEAERVAKEAKDRQEVLRKLAAAGDAEKLRAYAANLALIECPKLLDMALGSLVAEQHGKFIAWIEKKAESL